MKMPRQVALWLQFNLYLITLDGYCPDSFTSGKSWEMIDPTSKWQLAVDTISRCLTAGLMDVWNNGWMKAVGLKNAAELVNALAQHDPFHYEFPSDGAVYWLEPLLCATELCKSLVKKYELEKFEGDLICDPFIEDVEVLFEANGVGWHDGPLVTIHNG